MTPLYVPPSDIHPSHIWDTLERLSPERPPTPWDTKVERLLNGLRQPHLFIGRALSDRELWLLDRLLLRTHAHYVGGTGTGRSSLGLASLIFQLIAYADSSIVVFDMRGNEFLFWSTFIEANRAGLPFRWLSLGHGTSSFAYNPLFQIHNQQHGVNARAQSLLMSLGLHYGDAFRRTFYQSISLDTLTSFLTKFRDIRSFADFTRYAEEKSSYSATQTDEDKSQQLRIHFRQLAAVAALNVTDDLRSPIRPEILRDAIEMTDVLTRKQVIYFSLPSLEQDLTATSIAKLGLYGILQAATFVKRIQKSVPCYVVMDDFPRICGENISILLDMARRLGIHLVLSHRDMSQLKTVDFDHTSTLESNTTFKMVFEASSLTAMKHMEESSGVSRERTIGWTQAIHSGFDENDDNSLSLDQAYSNRDFKLPTVSVGERERATLTRNEILAVSAHPLRAFVRSRSDSGLTQYAGQWTAIECEFPTTLEEYETRSDTPIPTEHPSCVTVQAGFDNDDDGPPLVLVNAPLPVQPPPLSVDRAIADRLQALQDEIRNEHTQPPTES
jgi:hypothetical protein